MKKKNLVRRGLGVVLALVAAVSLAGCGKSASSASKDAYKADLVKKDTLTVAFVGNFPPYSYYTKDRKLTGFEVELGRKIAKRSGLKFKAVTGSWDSLVAGVGSHRFDVLLNNVTVTPERKKAYLFSTPYIYSHFALITEANNTAITSVKDIKGKKIGAGTGSDYATVADKYGAQKVSIPDWATNCNSVRQDRTEGFIWTYSAWSYNKLKGDSTHGLKAYEIPSSQAAPAVMAPMLNKKSTHLQKQVSKAIKSLKKDGTLSKLSIKYLGTDDTKE